MFFFSHQFFDHSFYSLQVIFFGRLDFLDHLAHLAPFIFRFPVNVRHLLTVIRVNDSGLVLPGHPLTKAIRELGFGEPAVGKTVRAISTRKLAGY